MSRPAGARNLDFGKKRQGLIELLTEYVLRDGVELPSFRQMADAAGTSESTLRHYFKNRAGVVATLLEHMNLQMRPVHAKIRQGAGTLEQAIDGFVEIIGKTRKSTNFASMYAFGMRESMVSDAARKAFVEYTVEPLVSAVAERLQTTSNGLRDEETAHFAGTFMMSSAIFMVLYQMIFDGRTHAPVDIDRYLMMVGQWTKEGLPPSFR